MPDSSSVSMPADRTYMDTPGFPSSHFMMVRRKRLHPYIRAAPIDAESLREVISPLEKQQAA